MLPSDDERPSLVCPQSRRNGEPPSRTSADRIRAVENLPAPATACSIQVATDKRLKNLNVGRRRDLLHTDKLWIELLRQIAAFVQTYATPFDIPAPKLRPVSPRMTTTPSVMYSQPWSPTPSTTAFAPLLRTAKRSPARPAIRRTSRPSRRTARYCRRSCFHNWRNSRLAAAESQSHHRPYPCRHSHSLRR